MSVFDVNEPKPFLGGWWRPIAAAVFTAVALALVSYIWYVAYRDSCTSVASWKFCKFSRHLFERALAVFVLGALLAAARPVALRGLAHASRSATSSGGAVWLALAGAVLVGQPLLFWGLDPAGSALLASVTSWAAGVALLACAALRFAAPWSAWGDVLRSEGGWIVALFLLGMALPEIGDTLFPLWHLDMIKDATLAASQVAAQLVGMTLTVDPAAYTIGQGDFFVRVNQSCSGIEGFALLTVFLIGYTTLFRQQIAPLRVAAILPFALALSWVLNVVRITVLIWIGINVSPTLAVEGFHSHAGWLIFICLSLGLIAFIHNTAWFQRERQPRTLRQLPPLTQDWAAARILPFAVFMFTAVVSSTFVEDPTLAYPLRMAAMAGVLWIFRAPIMALRWRIDPLAVGFGLAIGLAWVVFASSSANPEEPFGPARIGGAFLVVWIVCRIVGTSLIVPIIEELFFRSYLLDLLGAGRSHLATFFAVGVSTAAFAVLHDRMLLAALAGLVFAGLVLRPSGRLVDAVVAHIAANVLIAIWALASSDWTII
ncbi:MULTISPECIES: exosortase E/protease, VPEID-CTERM system [unclassified Mameliella]|uniref:exosortase E/protease, VPEID-CTERM system n=1 Tax=unclassified Mameliella TaxID=2630630 RepID=UPI00273E8280|nr:MULTISPECIES: exosortase E/protease, VPEID-CTERM system [unclassified Mameliella]